MSASWVTFLFEAANFLLLAGVLGWLFFRPVRDALERRRLELESQRQAAADAVSQAHKELTAARARRAEFEGSLDDLRKRVQREAEAERDRLLERAQEQTRRARAVLEEELTARRRAQASSVVRDAAFAAREIVVQILKELGGPDLESALCRATCRELEALRETGPLAPIVVESAAEIGEESFSALTAAAGVDGSAASRRVDPDLIAGLRVLTARGLVDASIAGLAVQAEQVLVRRLGRDGASHG